MIKKGLFAVALLAVLAMTVSAGDLAKNPIKVDSSTAKDPNLVTYMPDGRWPGKPVIYWPYEICYKPLELCQIPVYMEVGAYAEFKDCGSDRDTKIVMKQVDCATLVPQPQKRDSRESLFPCYTGCDDIEVRANFPAKLGTVLYRMADKTTGNFAIEVDSLLGPKWRAYFTTKYRDPGNLIPASGTYQKTQVCIDAWSADIFAVTIGEQIQVGEVAITIVPQ